MKKLILLLVLMFILMGFSTIFAQTNVDLEFRVFPDPNNDSTYIQVQTATDSLFTQIVQQSGNLLYNANTDTTYTYTATFPTTLPSVVYYWRGRAQSNGIYTAWGNFFKFTLNIDMLPNPPQPISPTNGTIIQR